MNLFGFGGGNKVDPEKAARDEASRQNIAAGGLPLNAIDRLQEQEKRSREGKPFFTSDLSPNELLLTHECGFEPLGQVMGSCVYQVGWQYLPSGGWSYSSGELSVMSESQFEARDRTFSRLRQEAKLLAADGVVGVRFTWEHSSIGVGMMELKAIGTAVRRNGAPPLAPGHEPFVSNLNGQDHWLLRSGGFMPVGFVFGSCVWYQYPDWRSQNAMMSWSNSELTSVTAGLYNARELAMTRLEYEARQLKATGVVGATFTNHFEHLESSQNSPGGFIMHCTAWGTAIAPDPSAPLTRTDIAPILSVQDPQP